jgi:hypothetical protein
MALTRIRAQQISNIDYKQAVRVVTTTNITLSGGAPISVDGVALSVNSRILVNGQSTATQNGLYLVQTLGTGSNGTWVRTTDTNSAGEMQSGMVVTVTEGNTYRDTLWTLTTDDPIVLGASDITFQQSTSFSFGNISANGTAILANTVGDAVTFVSSNNISITGNATAKTVTFGVTGIQSTQIVNGTSNVSIPTANGNVLINISNSYSLANVAVNDLALLSPTLIQFEILKSSAPTLGSLVKVGATVAAIADPVNTTTVQSAVTEDSTTWFFPVLKSWVDAYYPGGAINISGSDSPQWIFDTDGNLTSPGQISAAGNVEASNILTTGLVSAIGNITGDYILGNGSQLTGIVAGGGIEWTTQANTAPSSPVAGDFWYDSYTDKKYQYTNDGVSNYWVDQSFPTSFSSLAVTGNIVAGNVLITGNIVGNIVAETITANVIGSVTGNLTGNVFGNLIGNSYGNSTGTHFGNVTGNLTGSVLTAAQPVITTVGTLGSLSVTGNITTSAYFLGDGSQLTGISSTGSFIANGTSNISIATTNGNIAATVSGTEILKITSAGIENSRANGVGNIGSSTTYFNTVFAKATSAQYADLAEMYLADHHYEPGTVLVFGGVKEVTISDLDHDPRAAGVVSTQPSYLMNSGLSGKYPVELALTGRVPCQVQGPVEKGDRLVNVAPGIAGRLDTDKYQVGCVIGKSLEVIANTSIQMIEIAIGRY